MPLADNPHFASIPGLANVDHIDSVGAGLPEIRLHVHLEVLGTQVALSSKEHLNVLRGRVENRGELGGGHGERLMDDELGILNRLALVVRMERSKPKSFARASEEFRLRVVRIRARALHIT